jgi:hypothetical protein
VKRKRSQITLLNPQPTYQSQHSTNPHSTNPHSSSDIQQATSTLSHTHPDHCFHAPPSPPLVILRDAFCPEESPRCRRGIVRVVDHEVPRFSPHPSMTQFHYRTKNRAAAAARHVLNAYRQKEYCTPNWIKRAGLIVLPICPKGALPLPVPMPRTEGCRNDGWLNTLKKSERISSA